MGLAVVACCEPFRYPVRIGEREFGNDLEIAAGVVCARYPCAGSSFDHCRAIRVLAVMLAAHWSSPFLLLSASFSYRVCCCASSSSRWL